MPVPASQARTGPLMIPTSSSHASGSRSSGSSSSSSSSSLLTLRILPRDTALRFGGVSSCARTTPATSPCDHTNVSFFQYASGLIEARPERVTWTSGSSNGVAERRRVRPRMVPPAASGGSLANVRARGGRDWSF